MYFSKKTFSLPEKHMQELIQIAASKGILVPELMRQIVAHYLEACRVRTHEEG